ncbi:MAG: 30S ribosomal protein S8 [Patescibacteria group bacterium]
MYIDLLIKIKNAEMARKKVVKSPFSKMDLSVAELLARQNIVKKVEVRGRSQKKSLEIELKDEPVIHGLKLLSRPSRRLYAGYKEIKRPKGGYGLLVLSTPKGIMTASEALKQKVGGQLLFEIW